MVAKEDAEARFVVCAGLHTQCGKSVKSLVAGDALLKTRVELLGEVSYEDLDRQFYQKIGTLVFSSIWNEPFALTVLEAMASGTLVMGSQTGGTPEILDDSTGLLFDPNDLDSIVAAYRTVLSNADSLRTKIDAAHKRIQHMTFGRALLPQGTHCTWKKTRQRGFQNPIWFVFSNRRKHSNIPTAIFLKRGY